MGNKDTISSTQAVEPEKPEAAAAEAAPIEARRGTAQLTAEDRVVWRALVEEHRVQWVRDANPCYVSDALVFCPRDEPLPRWIYDCLVQGLLAVRDLASDPHLTPAEATERILEVLGFRRRPNWNAIEQWRRDNQVSGVLLEVATGKNSETPDHLVIGALAQRLKKGPRQIRNLRDEAIQRVIQGSR